MNLREQAILRAAQDIWARTGRPVSADAIAEASGFDDETIQQMMKDLCLKGFFADALRGDDRIDSIAF